MIAFVLLVTSAFLHALWNAIVKKIEDKDAFLILCMTASYLMAGITAWLLEDFTYGNSRGLFWSMLAGIFEGGYFLTLSLSLSKSSLGAAYAIMRGGAMLVVWLVSNLYLGEALNAIAMFGAVLVFVGIFLTQKNIFIGRAQGWYWPYLCALFIAAYHLCYDRALHEGSKPFSSFAAAMIMALPFLWFQGRKNLIPRLKTVYVVNKWAIGFAAIAATFSFGLFLWGLQYAGAGYAITLRNTSILFAAVFSVYLGDLLNRKQIIGIIVIAAGALILGAG